MNTDSNMLPNNAYWIAILALTALAAFSHISLPGGWILYIFPVIIYLSGRAKQEDSEGFRL